MLCALCFFWQFFEPQHRRPAGIRAEKRDNRQADHECENEVITPGICGRCLPQACGRGEEEGGWEERECGNTCPPNTPCKSLCAGQFLSHRTGGGLHGFAHKQETIGKRIFRHARPRRRVGRRPPSELHPRGRGLTARRPVHNQNGRSNLCNAHTLPSATSHPKPRRLRGPQQVTTFPCHERSVWFIPVVFAPPHTALQTAINLDLAQRISSSLRHDFARGACAWQPREAPPRRQTGRVRTLAAVVPWTTTQPLS